LESLAGNSNWTLQTWTLPAGANNNANFQIRFRTSHNGSADYAYLDGNLQEWVAIYQVSHYFTKEEVHDVTLAASNQALLCGITTVLDFASMNFREFSLETACQANPDWKEELFFGIPHRLSPMILKRMK
jgi:prepilin-type processing-associated H-X9-DG protein